MTVRNRRTKRDAVIKQYLIEGYTLASIDKFTKISPTRVGQIRNLLLESGELVEIPHTPIFNTGLKTDSISIATAG